MSYILIFILTDALEFMWIQSQEQDLDEMPNFSRTQIFIQILFCSLFLLLCALHEPNSSRFYTFPASKYLFINCSPLDVHCSVAISALWFLLSHFHLHGSTGWKILAPPFTVHFPIPKQFKSCSLLFSPSLMKIISNCKEMWMCNPPCELWWGLNHDFGRCKYLCCV